MSDDPRSREPTLTVGDSARLGGRRFTSQDLLAIEEAMGDWAGEEYPAWTIRDEQGEHTGLLSPVLQNVIWPTVEGFNVLSIQRVDQSGPLGSLVIIAGAQGTSVKWSCEASGDRESIERAFKRIVHLLNGLKQTGQRNAFVENSAVEDEHEGLPKKRHLWDRQPLPLPVAVIIGVVTSAIGSLIVAALLIFL